MFKQTVLFCVHKNIYFYVQHCHISDNENQVRFFKVGGENITAITSLHLERGTAVLVNKIRTSLAINVNKYWKLFFIC